MKKDPKQPKKPDLGDVIEEKIKEAIASFKDFRAKSKSKKARKQVDPDEKSATLRYIELLLKDRFVATVSPSSKFVVRRVLKALDLKNAKVVVEYGPADGVITKPILENLPKDALLIAIERNEEFFERLKEIKDPRFHPVHGDVRDIEKYLRQYGVQRADRIVSGIPFSYLTKEERDVLLDTTHERLNQDGRFVAYQVTTHLIPLLKKRFMDVDVEFEIRNVPPHFVFTAYK